MIVAIMIMVGLPLSVMAYDLPSDPVLFGVTLSEEDYAYQGLDDGFGGYTFTPSTNMYVTGASAYFLRFDATNTPDDIFYRLFETDGSHQPDAEDYDDYLTEGTLASTNFSSMGLGDFRLVGGDFTTPYMCESGTEYCIVFRGDTALDDIGMVNYDETGTWGAIYNSGGEAFPSNVYTSTSNSMYGFVYGIEDDSGLSCTNYYVTDTLEDVYWDANNNHYETWLDTMEVDENTIMYTVADGIYVGYTEYTDILNTRRHNNYRAGLGIDCTGVDEDNIESVSLYLNIEAYQDDIDYEMYLFVTEYSQVDEDLDTADMIYTYSPSGADRVSYIYEFDTVISGGVDSWFEFKIHPEFFTIDDNDMAWLYITTARIYYGIEPEDATGLNETKSKYVGFSEYSEGHIPYIRICEMSPPEDFEDGIDYDLYPETPANSDTTTPIENGIITSVEWVGVRTMYQEENWAVKVSGTPGTPVTLEFKNDDGVTLKEASDWIRDDGYCYYEGSMPSGYEGLCRVVETETSGESTEWGYLYNGDAIEQVNWAAGKSTDLEDNLYEDMSNFAVYEGMYIPFHWYSNVNNLYWDDYEIRIYSRGEEVYTKNMSDMYDEYYVASNEDNTPMMNYRYVLISPYLYNQASYDELVIDLDLDRVYDDYGYITCGIYNTDDTQITECNSAVWYLNRSVDEAVIGSVVENGYIQTDMYYGDSTHINEDFESATCSVWTDGTTRHDITEVLFGSGNGWRNYLNIPLVGNEATIRLVCGDEDMEYQYKHYQDIRYDSSDMIAPPGVPGTPGTPGTTPGWNFPPASGIVPGTTNSDDIIDDVSTWIDGGLSTFGLDGTFGHWLLMLIGMVVMFVIFRKHRTMRVVAPLMVIGLGIIGRWIPLWMVIMLALAAGFAIWIIFRRTITASGGD